MFGLIGHMCCKNTWKQKISIEWIVTLLIRIEHDLECVECYRMLNYNVLNSFSDLPGAETILVKFIPYHTY